MTTASSEIAHAAARLVVEEGLEYGPAKRRAVKQLGLNARTALPDNEQVEDAVFDYLAVFCADTQPTELRALRELAAVWMGRLAEFRPHLTGAVWRGTATRLNDIHLQLYCDDSKSAEIKLINQGMDYDVSSTVGPRGDQVDVLSLTVPCPALNEPIGLHLTILDHDDLRGGLKRDARGRSDRGDLPALQRLLDEPPPLSGQAGVSTRRALLATAAAAGLASGAWWAWRRQASASAAHALPGEALPADFWGHQFDTLGGPALRLASLQGHPTVLNFWATWCPPCVKEMPDLDRFHLQSAGAGWKVVGLAIDGPTPVREFLQKTPVSFPIGLAGMGGTELAQALGNTLGGLPFSVLIDAQGRLRRRKTGSLTPAELQSWVHTVQG